MTQPFQRARRAGICIASGVSCGVLIAAIGVAIGHVGNSDFDIFYKSGLAWRQGKDIYDVGTAFPNLNPPILAVIFGPLTRVAETSALKIWLAINLIAAGGAGALIWHELKPTLSIESCCTSLALAGLYIGLPLGLQEGQLTGILTLWLTGAWYLARRTNYYGSAVLTGLAIAIKPFWACLLLVYFRRRDWLRLTAAALLSVSAVFALTLPLTGVAALSSWTHAGQTVSWFNHPLNASLIGVIARTHISLKLAILPVIILLIITSLAVKRTDNVDLAWGVGAICSLLVSPLGWLYYTPCCLAPLLMLRSRRKSLGFASAPLVTPVTWLSAHVAVSPITAVTVFSLPSWSLLAMWAVLVGASFAPQRQRITTTGRSAASANYSGSAEPSAAPSLSG